MAKRLSLLKPNVRNITLMNDAKERVDFLQIPMCNGKLALENDVKLGAVQFQGLNKLLEKKKEPHYILITTDNLEMGYMAVSYLATGFNHKKYEELYQDCDCEFPIIDSIEVDMEEWEESQYKIPIILEEQINQELWNRNEGVPMGSFYGQANRAFMHHTPYWRDCNQNAVCIVTNNNNNYMGGFGLPNENVLHDGLALFKRNEKVYIINLDIPNPWDDEFEDDINERGKWNYEILSYAMDEVTIKLEEDQQSSYYRRIMQGFIARMGLKTVKNFRIQKVINSILPMKESQKCKLIEDILQYAIKDWEENHEMVLMDKDFLFLERFIKSQKLSGKADANGSAKERMMNHLIGMDSVKEQVLNVVNVMKFNALRANMKIKGSSYHNVHMMLGAPGTAKTTIAQLMGQIMVEEKLLPDSRFVCVNGAELKGMYVGHSAPKTKALFDEHDIIVIDEAYSLVSDNGQDDSFSKEAIAQLIIELEKHSMDKLVIFAGYGGPKVREKDNKMKAFLDANPGIKSRITSTIYFDSYTADEMVKIFYHIAKNQNYSVDEAAKDPLRRYFSTRIVANDFGNGREARSLLETTVIYAAKRVFEQKKKKYSKQDMQMLNLSDVLQAIAHMEQANGVQDGAEKKKIGFG